MSEIIKSQLLEAYDTIKKSVVDVFDDSMITVKVGEHQFLTRESLVNNRHLTEENLILIDENGKSEATKNIDWRNKIDQVVFQEIPEANCIVHMTSRYCSVWAQTGTAIPPINYRQVEMFGGEIICTEIPEHRDATLWQEDIADKVRKALQSRESSTLRALLVNKVEVLVIGKDLEDAVHKAICLEEFAYQAHLVGENNNGEYRYLPYSIIDYMNCKS